MKTSKTVWEEFNFGYRPNLERRPWKKKQSHKRAISYSTTQKKAIAQLNKGVDPEKINQDAIQSLQRKLVFGQLKKRDEEKLGKILKHFEEKQWEAQFEDATPPPDVRVKKQKPRRKHTAKEELDGSTGEVKTSCES